MADETPHDTPRASEEGNAPEPHQPAAFLATEVEETLKRFGIALGSQDKQGAPDDGKHTFEHPSEFIRGRRWVREHLFGNEGYLTRGLEEKGIKGEDATRYKMLFHEAVLKEPISAVLSDLTQDITSVGSFRSVRAKIDSYASKVSQEYIIAANGSLIEAIYLPSYVVAKAMTIEGGNAEEAFDLGLHVSNTILQDIFKSLEHYAQKYAQKQHEEPKEATKESTDQAPKEPPANKVRALYNKDRHHVRIEANLGADVAKLRDLEKFIIDGLAEDLNKQYNQMPYTATALTKEQLDKIVNPAAGFYFFEPKHIRAFTLMQGSLQGYDAVRLLRRVIDMVRECNHFCDGSDNRELSRMQEIEHLASVLAERFGRIYHMMPDEALLKSFFYTSSDDGHTTMRYFFNFRGKHYAGPFSVEGQTSSVMFIGPDLYDAAQNLYAACRSARHVAVELANSCENYEYTFENRRGQEEGASL